MSKNKKIGIVIMVAVLSAVLAVGALFMFLSPKRTTFYEFRDSYKSGTQITSDMLMPVQADSSIVVAGAQADASSIFITQDDYEAILKSGDSLKIDVSKGMPLMTSMLSVTGGNAIVMSMQPSAVAVTVDVGPTTGITSDLSAGSNVNVYVADHNGGAYLLFENMRILEVVKSSDGTLKSATLEVDNEEAVRLIDATQTGTIYFGLINSTGYQYVSDLDSIESGMNEEQYDYDDEYDYNYEGGYVEEYEDTKYDELPAETIDETIVDETVTEETEPVPEEIEAGE